MLSRSDVAAALNQLAAAQGLPELALDSRDTAVVEFGEEGAIIFEFSEDDGALSMWSPICSLAIAESLDDEYRLLKALLALNFPTSRLRGAHVGFDPEMGLVLLVRQAHFDPGNPALLSDLAQKFAQEAESLMVQLKDGSLLEDDIPLRFDAQPSATDFIRA